MSQISGCGLVSGVLPSVAAWCIVDAYGVTAAVVASIEAALT